MHPFDIHVVKKMDGHSGRVEALGISGEMQLIASSDDK
jgi:hypothetical protein